MWLLFISSLLSPGLASSITNGTCYYKADETADDSIYSPCGNTIDGNWPCCQLGDKCNNYNTCTWSDGLGTFYTYIAGCTDPKYQDDSCQDKGVFSDYQWVGLAWVGCTVNNDTGLVQWNGCPNDGKPAVGISSESSNCVCSEDGPSLLYAPTGLVAEGYLPATKMGPISWEPGWAHTDPTVSLMSSTSSSSSEATTTLGPVTTQSSNTPTSSSSSNDNATTTEISSATTSSAQAATTENSQGSGLHAGEKAGVAASVTIVGCVAIGVGILFLCRRRRTKQQEKKKQQALDFNNDPQDQEKNTSEITTMPALHAAPALHHNSTIISHHSELPGTPADPSFVSIMSSNTANQSPRNEYDVYYRPYQYRNPNAEIRVASGSPETVRSEQWQREYQPYRPSQAVNACPNRYPSGVVTTIGQSDNVHELPGSEPDKAPHQVTSSEVREGGITGRAEM